MAANRKYIYVSEKAPIYMLPRCKAQKYSKYRVTDIREKTVNFYHGTARTPSLDPKILLLTEVPLQKFPFL